VTERISPNFPQKVEPDDPKSATDNQREYSYDYFYIPSVGAVTENSSKDFGNYRYF
jgi:hypothetical protein